MALSTNHNQLPDASPDGEILSQVEKPNPDSTSTKLVSFADFSKLDIRIGTIVAVEVVPEADKLLRLEVDCGESSPRQIISGIRAFFSDPQVLVGKQCPFIINLEPRRIRGLESQGMILAADIPGTFALLEPQPGLPPGTAVH